MPTDGRGGLKSAFENFKRPESDTEAEKKLLGRTIDTDEGSTPSQHLGSYQVTQAILPVRTSNLTPKPLLAREAVRQLSFRCPLSVALDLRRKAQFNQLEQQEILIEGIKRVLAELQDPPPGWDG